MAQDGTVLTQAQVAGPDKAKQDGEAHGAFDSKCPDYCVARGTFYVGTLNGVSRIYQQTLVDICSKVGFARLYDTEVPITAAEMLNDRVLPFFAVRRVLTDRGTEYRGNP